jgi:hypothetical protein
VRIRHGPAAVTGEPFFKDQPLFPARKWEGEKEALIRKSEDLPDT